MPIYYPALTNIDIDETRRYAGIAKVPDFKIDLLQKVCIDAQILAKPAAAWSIYPYNCMQGLIIAQTHLKLTGNNIVKHLAGASHIAVLAVTIGAAVEEAINHCFSQGQYTEGLLLDAAATTAVEEAADQVNTLINQQARLNGLKSVHRFSPGYGDWDITIQPELLKLAPGTAINLSTTTSCMLIPRKSITAVIGLLPENNVIANQNIISNCYNCNNLSCFARKEYSNDQNI